MKTINADDAEVILQRELEDPWPAIRAINQLRAVPPPGIVRCGECIHMYDITRCPLAYLDNRTGIITARDSDFFCAYGEKE